MLVKGDRQPLEVGEQTSPQLEDHRAAELADGGDVGAGGRGLDQHGHGEGHDDQRERAGVVRLLQLRDLVNPHADQPRPGQGGELGGHDQQEDRQHQPPVRTEQAGQQPTGTAAQQRAQLAADLVFLLGGDAAPGLHRGRAHLLAPAFSPGVAWPSSPPRWSELMRLR